VRASSGLALLCTSPYVYNFRTTKRGLSQVTIFLTYRVSLQLTMTVMFKLLYIWQ